MQASEVKIGQRVKHRFVSECGHGTVLELPTGVNSEVMVKWDESYGKCAAYAHNLILVEQPKTAGHVHAELMKQYAEDAAKSETPWENWQVLAPGFDKWYNLNHDPEWFKTCQYRRKPKQKFIELNGKKFEIFAEKPSKGTEYFYVDTYSNTVDKFKWGDDSTDHRLLTENKCLKDEMTAKDFAEELKKVFNNVVES